MSRLWNPAPLLSIVVDSQGRPLRFSFDKQIEEVVSIPKTWRVDKGWWRDGDEIHRTYFKVLTRSRLLCEIYRDEKDGTWHFERDYD